MSVSVLSILAKAFDVKWDESKHPRRANGQFGRSSPLADLAEAFAPMPIRLGKAEYARVMSAINTVYAAKFKGLSHGCLANGKYFYLFIINDFDDYIIYNKIRIK